MPKKTIKLTSQPFGGDPPGAEAYYAALGRAIVLWGRFESQFSYLMDCIFTAPAARHLRKRDMPWIMARQEELLQRAFDEVPALAPLKGPILKILSEAKDAAEDRQVIVHGHWNSFLSGEPLVGIFIRHQHKGGKYLSAKYDVSLEKLQKMASTTDALNMHLLPIIIAAVATLHPPLDARKGGTSKR